MRACVILMVIALAEIMVVSHHPATAQRFNTDKENMKIAHKSMQFAHIIRENLRRNNDDYDAESFRNESQKLSKQTTKSYKVVQIAKRTPKRISRNIVTSKYTSPKSLPSKFMQKLMSSYPTPVWPKLNNESENRITIATNRHISATFRSNDGHQNLRLDRLKRLINKGKMKLAEIARTATTSSINQDALSQRPIKVEGASFGETTTTADTSPSTGSVATKVQHAPATHHVYPVRWPHPQSLSDAEHDSDHSVLPPVHLRSPSPDQLDMAHARGTGIHSMRVKGRLCQRVVLNREGPWYNARGKIIMSEHKPELTKGKEFHMTRTPEFVLPRCCNCCKKSVLGCQ